MPVNLPVGATTIGSAGDIDGAVATGVWAKIKEMYTIHLDKGRFCSTTQNMLTKTFYTLFHAWHILKTYS